MPKKKQDAGVCEITVYPYIEFDDETAVICKYTGEHAVDGLNPRLPMRVCRIIAEQYRKTGKNPTGCRPVGKRAYERFMETHPDGTLATVAWDENGAYETP